jgi:hypothetical protein
VPGPYPQFRCLNKREDRQSLPDARSERGTENSGLAQDSHNITLSGYIRFFILAKRNSLVFLAFC